MVGRSNGMIFRDANLGQGQQSDADWTRCCTSSLPLSNRFSTASDTSGNTAKRGGVTPSRHGTTQPSDTDRATQRTNQPTTTIGNHRVGHPKNTKAHRNGRASECSGGLGRNRTTDTRIFNPIEKFEPTRVSLRSVNAFPSLGVPPPTGKNRSKNVANLSGCIAMGFLE